ncbi:hypothetical protein GIB67_022469 [Kingdonia uniflora]|uniref:Uncharacterized protein n=1 Tax=Kingdonia uniflora TaxID=39325 RepID=A0A7J7MTY9_9MAGN|nr:hypothetical protein GIB67_022469 [Kingdonia uniflora]
METQRVWDFAGDNYEHGLIQSKADGKLIELNSHCIHTDGNYGSCECFGDAILNEYNELLTSQPDKQQTIYENLMKNEDIWKSKILEDGERFCLFKDKKVLRLKDGKIYKLETQRFIDAEKAKGQRLREKTCEAVRSSSGTVTKRCDEQSRLLPTIGKGEIAVLIERAKQAKERDTKAARLQVVNKGDCRRWWDVIGGRKYRVGSCSTDQGGVEQFRVAPRVVEISDEEATEKDVDHEPQTSYQEGSRAGEEDVEEGEEAC